MGEIERLQILAVGLPGIPDETLFDTDALAAKLEEEEDVLTESDSEVEDEDFDELHNLRCKHNQFLFDHILLHTHVPQRLGQGHTTLVDKVSAHIHSTLL